MVLLSRWVWNFAQIFSIYLAKCCEQSFFIDDKILEKRNIKVSKTFPTLLKKFYGPWTFEKHNRDVYTENAFSGIFRHSHAFCSFSFMLRILSFYCKRIKEINHILFILSRISKEIERIFQSNYYATISSREISLHRVNSGLLTLRSSFALVIIYVNSKNRWRQS